MAMLGTGLLAIWHDLEEPATAAFTRWYRTEHLRDRVSLPGFQRGRRYVAREGAPRYAALYEAARPEDLSSAAYKASLNNPSPETRRIMPHFRNMNRTVCRLIASHGTGVGRELACFWLSPPEALRDDLAETMNAEILPALAQADGMIGAHLGVGDPALTRVESAEADMRGGPDKLTDWVLLAEAIDPESLKSAIGRHLHFARLAPDAKVTSAHYKLVHTVSAADFAP